MKFIEFVKERWLQFLVLIIILFTIEVFLIVNKGTLFIQIYIAVTLLLGYLLMLWLEYARKNGFYQEVQMYADKLDQKYLLPEVISHPDFIEGKLLYEILQITEKSMIEHINEYKSSSLDYKDFIELWIHEVKLPIATSKMIVENNKSDVTSSIEEELDKIDGYTEQALFYARSKHVEKDYLITKVLLREIVSELIIKNKKALMGHVQINVHDLEVEVHSDSKWLLFILQQILTNSIKYSQKENRELEFFSKANKENIELHIRDNGIGIAQDELGRVFDKGFTGQNGRNYQKSTGIGLYLCQLLCQRLGHQIKIQSEVSKGTELTIVFPKGSFTNF